MPKEYVLELGAVLSTKSSESQPPKTIVGYCAPWTARPGEQIEFKVSSHIAEEYDATLVRLTCADNHSAHHRYQEEEIPASFCGRHAGRYQPTYPGSFVHVPSNPTLDGLRSFTVQAVLFPTRLPSQLVADSSSDGDQCEQHIVSRWNAGRRLGWALLIDRHDRLVFRIGDHAGVRDAAIGRPLTERQWYLAVASVDIEKRLISLLLECCSTLPGTSIAEPRVELTADCPSGFVVLPGTPLLFAACVEEDRSQEAIQQTCCFNGRLDRIRISSPPVDFATARSLRAPTLTANAFIVGFWDFAAGIDRIEVHDLSHNRMHGRVVNAPMRGVVGVDWDGSTHDWRYARQHFSAIHFHDDDLYDAQWSTDFKFLVPEELPSGVYAARLRQGHSEDYVPFFVAPSKRKRSAPVAVLLPTAAYTAYTNVTSIISEVTKVLRENSEGHLSLSYEGVGERTIWCDPAHLEFLKEQGSRIGCGVYAFHTDGTVRTTASQQHPNESIKPKGMNWTLVADSYLIDWLSHKQIDFDVLTDDLLHQEGVDLLSRYRVIITGNHPEYYSKDMLDSVSRYQQAGGRWMYLGGNGFYWVTSFHSQLPGLVEIRKSPFVAAFERRHAFDGVNGGLWRDNGRSPQQLMGVGHSAVTMNSAGPYRRLPGSYAPRAAFIFAGIEGDLIGDFGVIGGGAAGQEVDRIGTDLGTPSHALHLARADGLYRTHPEIGEVTAPVADMVFFEVPRGGAVFSVGSMAWVGSLSYNNYCNSVSRITENVLGRFMAERPFELCST